jgi:hypothetical protein
VAFAKVLVRVVVERGDGNGVVDVARKLGVVTGKAVDAEESGRVEAVAEVSSFMSLTEVTGPVARSLGCDVFSTANSTRLLADIAETTTPYVTHINTYLAFFQRARAST